MRVPASPQPTRERGLMVMTGLALLTSLVLGGAAASSLWSAWDVSWEASVARPVRAVEPAPATPAATPSPAPASCGERAESRGPVGPPAEQWRFDRGRTIYAAPTLANGILYVGSWDGNLAAIDARTGAERWQHHIGGVVSRGPVTGAGMVYAADTGKTIHALDAATGRPRWRVAVRDYPAMALAGDALFVVSGKNGAAPAVAGDTVYAGGGNEDLVLQSLEASTGAERWRVPLSRNGLYALDAATGAERWQFGTESWVSAAPFVDGESIYVVDEALHKVEAATGRADWSVPVERGAVVTNVVADSAMVHLAGDISAPRSDGQAGISQSLFALDAATGAERWRFPTGNVDSSAPAVAGGTVFVGGDGRNLYALDGTTGHVRWTLDLGARLSTPVVHCGVLYVGLHGESVVAIANA